jgi:hypothetical protein
MQNGPSHSSPQTLPFSIPPYLLSVDDVARILVTDLETGLSTADIPARQTQYGQNAVIPHLFRLANDSWKEEEG